MIKLDGSFGEGGGQIIRNAAAYAAILRKDLTIRNIRAGRPQPGLRRQHITGLRLLADACGGTVEGASVGSQEIVFRVPFHTIVSDNKKYPIRFKGDTKTAGSICLLLQAALPFALLALEPIHWVFRGGTNATMAPQYDYWELLFLPTLMHQLRFPPETVQSRVIRRGFYPKGGGEVQVTTNPVSPLSALPSISLVQSKCPRRVAEEMATAAKDYLVHVHLEEPVPDISVSIVYEESAFASGSGILILATTTTNCRLGGSAVGTPKLSPTLLGIQAAQELCATLKDGGCVDEYLQDQLVLYMALAEGTSEMITGSLTLHTQTAIWVAEQCCDVRFQVDRLDGKNDDDDDDDVAATFAADAKGRVAGRHRIQCNGIGFSP